MNRVPAVSVRRSSFCDRLHEDAQLLQAHVRPCTHPDDADAQAVAVCGEAGNTSLAGTTLLFSLVLCSFGLSLSCHCE